MRVYEPPLKIHWLMKFLLVACAFFILSPVAIFAEGLSLRIGMYEYILPEYPSIKWLGATIGFLVGVSAILVLWNVQYSLTLIAFAFTITQLSGIFHPHFESNHIANIVLGIFIFASVPVYLELKRVREGGT